MLLDRLTYLARDNWERYSPDDYAEKLRGLRMRPHDFVMAGGSPVNNGFIPAMVEGVSRRGAILSDGYVVGLPGGTIAETYVALTKGCVKPPRLLICGVTASDFNDSRNQSHGPASLMDWSDLRLWKELRPKALKWATLKLIDAKVGRFSALFHYRHGIKMWAAASAERLLPGTCSEVAAEAREKLEYSAALRSEDGFAPNPLLVERRFDLTRERALNRRWPHLDRYQTGSYLRYFRRLLDWAQANGTEVVLVDMPVTQALEERYAGPFREYRARLAEIERDYPAIEVLRPGREGPRLSDATFADLIHLNAEGARRLSGWLRARLEASG